MKMKKICLTCKASFKVRSFEVKRGYGKYCSRECFYTRPRKETKGECIICGKKFIVKNSELKKGKGRGKYCSRECSRLGMRQFKHSDETKMKIYISKKGKKRPAFSESWIENIRKAMKGRIFSKSHKQKLALHLAEVRYNAAKKKLTNPEKIFNELTPDIIRFTGNRVWWRKLPNGKYKNPDFKVTGKNKVIEVFGNYFHRNDNPQDLINLYKQIGIDCLVIWENEIYNQPQLVLEKVNDFISANYRV